MEQLIPLAMGIALSPIPLAALIAILLTSRARGNALAFTATAIVSTAVIVFLAALGTSGATGGAHGTTSTVHLVVSAVITVVFLLFAVFSWRSRPHNGAEPKPPSWLTTIDTMGPGKAAVLCLLLTVPNAKNLPLEIKAGSILGGHHTEPILTAGIALLFGLGSAVILVVLSALAYIPSPAIAKALAGVKAELINHNAIIMTALFLLLAAVEAVGLISALNHR